MKERLHFFIDIDNYNKIVIEFPVGWYKEPSIIDTFLEENNLGNKGVYKDEA